MTWHDQVVLVCVTGSAEKLFNLCDEYADNQRKKIQVWPLQNTLLILCPVSPGHLPFTEDHSVTSRFKSLLAVP